MASFVADANFARRYGRLCKPIDGASMVLGRAARISGEITDYKGYMRGDVASSGDFAFVIVPNVWPT